MRCKWGVLNFSIFFLIFLIFFIHDAVFCAPPKNFMDQDEFNGRVYFYNDINIDVLRRKMVLEQFNWVFKNFDQTSFELVRFLKSDGTFFPYKHPNNHPNVLFNIPISDFNYHISFSFSHKNLLSASKYFEFWNKYDLMGSERNQYRNPYAIVNNKHLVNYIKIDTQPFNYLFNVEPRFRIYNKFKLYF